MKDNTAWMATYNSKVNSSEQMSYVTADGNYGSDDVLVFPYNALTEEQWNLVEALSDYDKLPYVYAVVNGKSTDIWDQDWHQE